MGQIRSNYIKKVCDQIYEIYPTRVTSDFETNKILVQEVTDVSSNMLRNRIAGYLVTMKNKEGRLIQPPKKQRKARSKKDRVKKQFRKWVS